ncbi:hypothetical protein C0J52_09349 [Blattella germanica]|nr:hypothetical protein C0J52_09349 [Blattella germanica]
MVEGGDTHQSQGSAFISEIAQLNVYTPSPRSLPGGASDQALVFNSRQHDSNHQVDTPQQFKDAIGTQRDPYHFNIRESSNPYQINFKDQDNPYLLKPEGRGQYSDSGNFQTTHTAAEYLANQHHPAKNPVISVQHNDNYNANIDTSLNKSSNQETKNGHETNVDRYNNFGSPAIDNDSIVPADLTHNQETRQPSGTSQERFYSNRFPSFSSPGDMLSVLAIGVRSAAQEDDDDYIGGNYSESQRNFNHVNKPYRKGGDSFVSTRDELPGVEISRNYSSSQQRSNAQVATNFSRSGIATLEPLESSAKNYKSGSLALSNGGAIIVNKSLEETQASIEPRLIEVPKSFPFDEVLYNQGHHDIPVISPEGRIVTPNSYKYHSTLKVNTTNRDPDSSGSKIVFPGEMPTNADLKFRPQIKGRRPECADDNSFCESVDQYPQLIPVDTRIQPDEQVFLCPSREHVVYPKMAQNKDDKWLFVVNQDSYVQGVRIEKCERQETCSFMENFPPLYVTSCQQKYIYRKLLALGEDGNPTSDTFRFPSCCSCVLTKQLPTVRSSDSSKPRSTTSRKRRR